MFNEMEFRSAMVRQGFTEKTLAAAIGLSERTLSKRIKNSDTFKVTEVCKLVEVLKIDDPGRVFFGE